MFLGGRYWDRTSDLFGVNERRPKTYSPLLVEVGKWADLVQELETTGQELPHSNLLSPYILEAADPSAWLLQLARLGGVLFLTAGILGTVVSLLPGGAVTNPRGIGFIGLTAILAGLGMLAVARALTALHLYLIFLIGALLVTLSTYFSGVEGHGYGAMLYSWVTTLGFSAFKKRWLVPQLVLIGVGFGIVTGISVPGWVAATRWLFLMGTIVALGYVISMLVQHLHRLATSESRARAESEEAKNELNLVNLDLEDRVKAKIAEVERLSELRRLVSAQVADALLESGDALEPHRREIAAFFIDLRGFTRFAIDSDPEEVISVLDQFYRVLGRSFKAFDATVGAFEADGVMAYFNDPVPIDDPAKQAVDMALDLRGPMERLVTRWHARGFDLHYGIGIAFGFATMGMVGFDGRQDYTAIGPVVNLASRLCDKAKQGEVLIDRNTKIAVDGSVETQTIEPMELKGFRDPVQAFRISMDPSMEEIPTD